MAVEGGLAVRRDEHDAVGQLVAIAHLSDVSTHEQERGRGGEVPVSSFQFPGSRFQVPVSSVSSSVFLRDEATGGWGGGC